jgi:hypothetical protein
MKPYINIHLYPQTQTVATNIYYYTHDGQINKETHTRYMVDHIYEIIFPIVEQYGTTHTINVGMNGKPLDIQQLEQDYYDAMNGDVE